MHQPMTCTTAPDPCSLFLHTIAANGNFVSHNTWRQVLLQSISQKVNSDGKTSTCLEGKSVDFKKETVGRILGICRVV